MEMVTIDETGPLVLLKYFDIFKHPLKLEELFRFSAGQETTNGLRQYLDEMVAMGTVKKSGEFYMCAGGNETYIRKRLEGEKMAGQLIPRAKKVGKLIAHFPFVKFVGISGSLSKGYADRKTDFDFFIITANNTLWICRTLLHLFKKISFLAGKQHMLCMNYFMDEQHLALEEQNIFTRIELSTLIPVHNLEIYYQLLLQNRKNLPNLTHLLHPAESTQVMNRETFPHKEKNKIWRPLNLLLMHVTDWKWKRKWKKKGYHMEDYPLAFKTTPYVSKNHPKNYQKTVLQLLDKKRC